MSTKASHSARPMISTKGLQAYPADRFTLIPLHRYSGTRTKNGVTRKTGKAPFDFNWTAKAYNTAKVVARCVEENRNVGVRLKPDQLVIDVDPRNGGTVGFTDLCLDFGLDDTQWPHVITGSGGSHFYMRKPAGVPVLDTLKDYPGVEFKSKGRQVVAAGSIHPDTKIHYKWDTDAPSITDDLPMVPTKLLRIITRPQRATVEGGGQYDQAQVAKMLDELDPTEFRDQSAWLKLMMACHHASDGDARSEFIEWSCGDPQYSEDAEIVGRRWDSLHRERSDGVTAASLRFELKERGLKDAIPAADASQDFDAVEDDDTSWLEGGDTPLIKPRRWDMNRLATMLNYAEDAILRGGAPLYRMGERLVHPVRIDADAQDSEAVRRRKGSLIVREVGPLRLNQYMIEHCRFYKVKKDKRIAYPAPVQFANHLIARDDQWRMPILNGVIEAPTLRADGSLLTENGYDAESGLLLDTGGVVFPTIKDAPMRDDALAALAKIKEPFKGFPFVGNLKGSASRSVMLSAGLTTRAQPRTMYSTPAYAIASRKFIRCRSARN